MENSTSPLVIILGTKHDDHVTSVSKRLDQLSVPHTVIDYLERTPVNFLVDEQGQFELMINGEAIASPFVIWDRLKMWAHHYAIKGDRRSAHYESQEWHAFFSLLTGTFSQNVVNSPKSRLCLLKPYQQIIASKAGFLVPTTLITNTKARALKFQDSESSLILKSLSAGKVIPRPDEEQIPYNVMTMAIDRDVMLASDSEEIKRCPHFLQRSIPKAYELRIVVVGDRAHAFRINSQDSRLTETDWRNGLTNTEFIPVDLLEETESKIRYFMDHLQLFSGSMDIIVDNEGKHWFLECNQDGQWMWLDAIVDGTIAKSFAEALVHKVNTISSNTKNMPL